MDEVRVKRSFSIHSFYNAVLLYSLLMEHEASLFTLEIKMSTGNLSPSLLLSKFPWMEFVEGSMATH